MNNNSNTHTERSSGVGYTTGEHLWYEAWLYGIIVDDVVSQLGSSWQPNGCIENGYYFPEAEDAEYPIISIDSPPVVDTAWDAAPI